MNRLSHLIQLLNGSRVNHSRLNVEIDLESTSSSEQSVGLSESQMRAMPVINNSQIPTDDSCSICLTIFHEDTSHVARQAYCGHRFHEDCLFRWFQMHTTCPVCRCQFHADDDDDYPSISDYSNYDVEFDMDALIDVDMAIPGMYSNAWLLGKKAKFKMLTFK